MFAGVGDERHVERLGELRRQPEAELAEHVAQDLAGRGGRRVDQVDVAEARVVVMVVDVDREGRLVQHDGIGAEPALVRTIDREQCALGGVGGQLALKLVELQEAVLARERGRAGEEHDAVLS